MSPTIPPIVESVLAATDDDGREAAWAEFLNQYSRLVIHVARSTQGDHDSVMDRYVFVLDALRKDNFKRLAAYSDKGRGAFTTWLVAVVRRLCIDEHRQRFGRSHYAGAGPEDTARRNLAELSGDDGGSIDSLESALGSADSQLHASERSAALRSALLRLNVADRLLLRLRYDDNLKVNEIARLLGEQSQFKVYRRLDQLLARLRRDLELVGINDPIA